MWRQADTQNMVPKPIAQYSWEIQDSRALCGTQEKMFKLFAREFLYCYVDVSVQQVA